MMFASWLRSLRSRIASRSSGRTTRPAPRRPQAGRTLLLERLEDRTLLSAGPAAAYGSIPLSFEANQGQVSASQVNFLARGSGYALFLTPTEAVLGLQHAASGAGPAPAEDVLRMRLVGGNAAAPATGVDKLAATSNYLIGGDPSQWHTDVANYGKVEYQGVYAGIDLTYYGNQRQLEYDFVAGPGADPSAIRLAFEGAHPSLDAHGDLVLHTAGGDVVEHAPVLYQESGGVRQAVSGHYVLEGGDQVGFQVAAYDTSRALTIDPVLSYSTYLGGSGNDQGNGIALDSAGDAYVVGTTASANFPTTAGVFQGTNRAAPNNNVFVAKLNPTGTGLVYSTYLGGTSSPGDFGYAIAVDASGNAYVTGAANSTNFPTTAGAFQPTSGPVGGAFVTKLNATGSALVYSTYLHGSFIADAGTSIAIDASGNAYVTGYTGSSDFPTTAGAFQPTWPAGASQVPFITKLNAAGSALVYSTFLGGSTSTSDQGTGIAVDAAGNAYVTGSTYATDFPTALPFQAANANSTGANAFVTKLNAAGSALAYSTYLGGSGNGGSDYGQAIAVDASGSAYVTGHADSTNFPTTAGGFQRTAGGLGDAFVTKLTAVGSALTYSTYLGGAGNDTGDGIAVDASGNPYVTGQTLSPNFPTTAGAFQQTLGGLGDAFATRVNAAGSALDYSTYLGGSGNDVGSGIAVDASGNAYVVGTTSSTNFTTTAGAFQGTSGGSGDAFLAKISPAQSPTFAVAGFPSTTTAGVAHTFTVTAKDASGNTNSGYTGTVHFTSSDPQAVLPADYTFATADQGVHSFSATLKTAGTRSITATDTVTGSMTGTQAGIAVTPAAASRLVISGPASVSAGVAFSVTITAYDAFGNVATGYTGTVHFTSNDSRATLPANYTFAPANHGAHTFTGLKLRTKGKQTITVADTLNPGLTVSLIVNVV